MKNKVVGYWILAFVFAVIIGLGFFTDALSIAQIVSERYSPSVSDAFESCRVARGELIRQGLDCEQCALVASAYKSSLGGDGLYDFSYEGATRYSGEYEDLSVDYINGNKLPQSDHVSSNPSFYKSTLLEVKSYCQDSIRVCEVQDGDAVVIDTIQVSSGDIQKLSVAVGFNDCTTDKIQSVTSYEIYYKLICASDFYYVDGLKISKDINELGVCVLVGKSNKEGQAGSFKSVVVDDEVKVNSEVHARGVFVAQEAGSYLVSAGLKTQSLTPLSVVTGFSASDPCGRGINSASKYFTLEKGDSAIFDLVFRTPNKAGAYEVVVEAVDNCEALNTYDYEVLDMVVLASESYKEAVISKVITSEPEFYEQYVKKLSEGLEEVGREGCGEDGDIVVEGCVVARCEDGETYALDEIVCDDGEVINPADVYGSLETPTGLATGKLLSFKQGGFGVFSVVIVVLLVAMIGVVIYYLRGKRK